MGDVCDVKFQGWMMGCQVNLVQDKLWHNPFFCPRLQRSIGCECFLKTFEGEVSQMQDLWQDGGTILKRTWIAGDPSQEATTKFPWSYLGREHNYSEEKTLMQKNLLYVQIFNWERKRSAYWRMEKQEVKQVITMKMKSCCMLQNFIDRMSTPHAFNFLKKMKKYDWKW